MTRCEYDKQDENKIVKRLLKLCIAIYKFTEFKMNELFATAIILQYHSSAKSVLKRANKN